MKAKSLLYKSIVLFFAVGLSACGDVTTSTDTGTDPAATAGGNTTSESTVLYGSVGDGPVVNANIEVFDRNDNLLSTQLSDATANYELTVRTGGSAYPLLLSATNGLDIVTGRRPDFTMKSVVYSPGRRKRVNINPFSTMIVEVARRMSGGMTQANIDSATQIVIEQFNFGYDTALLADPITGSIDNSNVSSIIKSSETLGEMLRRSRDALQSTYTGLSADGVIAAVAADIVDGVLDGVGEPGADPRVAATVTIASAQVLAESITGRLKVNGYDATVAMNNAVIVTQPGASADVSGVPVVTEMLTQARIAVAAAQAVDANGVYTATLDALLGMPDGSLPASVATVVPTELSATLGSTLVGLGQASSDTMDKINAVVRNNGDTTGTIPAATNTSPTISGTPATSVQIGLGYRFTPLAADIDGDTLSFSITGLPRWARFDTTTGTLTGVPGSSDVGLYSGILISVSDGQFVTSLPSFGINVTAAPNSAPAISGVPATTAVEGVAYAFTPRASDPDGNTLSFSISNRPLWASFDTRTGKLSGTPGAANIGVSAGIVITVSDGMASASLPAFSISVSPAPNSAPVIRGTPPASVMENASYSFTPTASDADGDALSFSVSNLPRWASFNARTGSISGTPPTGSTGVSTGIVITVSDGKASTSLPAFSITVIAAPVSTGSATLTWTPPTENTDGTSLSDLAGYRIYYGTQAGVYPEIITVSNPGVTSYVVENLTSGKTYYFIVTAFSNTGAESEYSQMGSKAIP